MKFLKIILLALILLTPHLAKAERLTLLAQKPLIVRGTGNISSVDYNGNTYALIPGGTGIEIYNISDHRNPTLAAIIYAPATEAIAWEKGGRLYLAALDTNLKVYDISDFQNPNFLDSLPRILAPFMFGLISSNRELLYGCTWDRVVVVSIADPRNIILMGAIAPPTFPQNFLATHDSLAFTTHDFDGLVAFNIKDPHNMREIWRINGRFAGVTADNNYLYAASFDESDFYIYKIKFDGSVIRLDTFRDWCGALLIIQNRLMVGTSHWGERKTLWLMDISQTPIRLLDYREISTSSGESVYRIICDRNDIVFATDQYLYIFSLGLGVEEESKQTLSTLPNEQIIFCRDLELLRAREVYDPSGRKVEATRGKKGGIYFVRNNNNWQKVIIVF
jgi:hypothetical protein